MPAYLLAYHGGSTPDGEDAQAAVMDAWNDWMGGIADQLIDGGNPVGDTVSVGPDGTLGDAPADRVTGYSIVEADDMEAAIAMARGCPILSIGGNVEIAELLGIEFDDDEDEDEDD